MGRTGRLMKPITMAATMSEATGLKYGPCFMTYKQSAKGALDGSGRSANGAARPLLSEAPATQELYNCTFFENHATNLDAVACL